MRFLDQIWRDLDDLTSRIMLRNQIRGIDTSAGWIILNMVLYETLVMDIWSEAVVKV